MPTPRKKRSPDPPHEVRAIRAYITEALNLEDSEGRTVGNCKWGVYLFYDYDGEPIYVGRTRESLRNRMRRHLTNQRTDAVAMNVLDPFEVAEVEMWPLWELDGKTKDEGLPRLTEVEFGVYRRALRDSEFGALLNEKDIPPKEITNLPPSYRVSIVPKDLHRLRSHPDVRIARRANTIANLARVISERSPSVGLRRTLRTQAKRLELLARQRYEYFNND